MHGSGREPPDCRIRLQALIRLRVPDGRSVVGVLCRLPPPLSPLCDPSLSMMLQDTSGIPASIVILPNMSASIVPHHVYKYVAKFPYSI
jgi:hypothetical protein